MNQKGVDRNQLCADLGLKYSTVSEWLSAKKYPRIDKIELLANYFGVHKSDLIESERVKDNPTAHEWKLLRAYRQRPDAQPFVDKLLDLPAHRECRKENAQ
ncbi:MAG: helix-turn-helix transcriptional regulator [Clostridia bacterium]|nr:helix-turn-helix transcriptional regulator [Clostridia bacterium]